MKTYFYVTKAMPYLYLPIEFEVFPRDEASQPYFAKQPIIKEIDKLLNGTVAIECDVDEIDLIKNLGSRFMVGNDITKTNIVARNSCLDFTDMQRYLSGKNGYAYYLTNVKPCDLRLSDFEYTKIKYGDFGFRVKSITKAPQSYQYAYYKGEKVLLMSIKSKYAELILKGEKTVEIRKTRAREIKRGG